MARVKRAVNAHKKRRVILERAEGYRGQRSRLYRKAKEQVTHSLVYSYRDRRAAQGRVPPPVDPAHQRCVACERPDLQPPHPGPRPGRHRGRPPHPRRARRPRARHVRVARRDRQGRPARRHVGPQGRGRPRSTLAARARRIRRSRARRPGAMPCACAPLLDNPRSPRVRAVAKLAKRDARAETGLFLLEGPQAVSEALAFRPELVVELFATPTALERYPELARRRRRGRASRSSSSPRPCSTRWPTPSPRRASSPCAASSRRRVKDIFAARRRPRLIAILEEVRDPGNAGTIIRAADAAGADAVILTGRSVDLYNPKVVRATTGLALPPARRRRRRPRERRRARAREAGLQVLAADVKGDDLLAGAPGRAPRAPTAWLFGNEARGLTDDDLALADRAVVGADLRPRRVDEPGDRRLRLPLRERVRATRSVSCVAPDVTARILALTATESSS